MARVADGSLSYRRCILWDKTTLYELSAGPSIGARQSDLTRNEP